MVTLTFNTACTALTLPYTETFEAASNTLGCWTIDGPGNWSYGTGDYSASTGAYEGSQNAKITHGTTGNVTKLISPVLDGAQSGLVLDFAYVMRKWGNDVDELRVYSRSDADSAWQQVAEFTTEAATWTVETVIIPGSVYQIAFEYTDNYGYGVGVDSVVFTAISGNYCYAISNLVASNATANGVTLTWSDDNNSGATYTIYNMADNSVIATGVAATNYDVTGLAPLSSYTFGVVANCSATDQSSIVTVDAITACGGTTCNITIVGYDSYGDGWNGNAINIIQNGITIATFTLPDDTLLTETFAVCDGTPVSFSWESGLYPGETSFEIFDGGNNLVYSGAGSSMTSGVFFTLNDACSGSTPGTDTLTVTFAINNPTMGTITPAPGTYQYFPGDTLFISATANTGYNFIGWERTTSLGVDTLDAQYASASFPVSSLISYGSMTFTALFEAGSTPTQYTVTLNTADAAMGTVSPTGATTVNAGASFTATATANTGYEFVAWMDGNTQVSTANPYTFTVNGDITLTATFASTATPCDVPTGLTATEIGADHITITWDNNVNVTSWNVRYRPVNGTWASATASSNTYDITGLTPETQYDIQVQANCGDGNLSDWSASINATTTVGIENHLLNSISLYPNPANEYIDVRVNELNVTNMEVYDVYGKLISTVNVIDNPTRINVSGLANGMYFVRVTTEQGVATKSFIKK